MGYKEAGFEVFGVDDRPQKNYPFMFRLGDAVQFLEHRMDDFDVIHASPPCQAYSRLNALHENDYPELIEPIRLLCEMSGKPYVIENVPDAPLRAPILLCGSMFGLGANGRQLRKHRHFESNVKLFAPSPCQHAGQPIGTYGHGGGTSKRGFTGNKQECADAMRMPWGTKAEIAQAIPPAYTSHIGRQVISHLLDAPGPLRHLPGVHV